MASEVMTVTGPISADELGFTLVHEHIYLDLMPDAWVGPNYMNDPVLAEMELMRYKNAGGVTLVDQTSGGLRENDHNLLYDEDLNHLKHANAIRDMSEKTGLNIVLGCGWYRETYYEQRLWRMHTNDIADEIIKDVTEGIDGTDVRAGFIGEIGAHFNWLSAIEERVLRAAARAQVETGVALGTHATRGPQGTGPIGCPGAGGRGSQPRSSGPFRQLSPPQVPCRNCASRSIHILRPHGRSEDWNRLRTAADAEAHQVDH